MQIVNVKPYHTQNRAVELSRKHDNIALLWEMGTGKSLATILILLDKYSKINQTMKTLILGPTAVSYNWQDELQKYTTIPRNLIQVIDKTGKQRLAKFNKATCSNKKAYDINSICILNYEALLNKDLLNAIRNWSPDILVYDEMHMLKNHQSKRSKAVSLLAQDAKYKIGLTGTLILNKLWDVFMPYRCLDPSIFGNNFYVFRDKYFMDENAGFKSRPTYFPSFVAREEMMEELQSKVYSIGDRVRKEDCLDLPPRVEVVKQVPLSKEQEKLYKEMKRDFITFINENSDKPKAVVAELAVTKALRMMQIVSGHVKTDEGEVICLKETPRDILLKEILEEITTQGHKVIVWCSYKEDYKRAGRICDSLKIPYVSLVGGLTGIEKHRRVTEFESSNAIKVVIANRKAAGVGINLVSASYSIGFSRNFSLEEEMQSRDRNHRGGSQIHEKIIKIEIVTPNTIDELAYNGLQSKEEMSSMILDMRDKI